MTPFDVPAPELGATGSRFELDGVDGRAVGPRRPQRPQRRRGADRVPARGGRPRAPRPRRWRTSPAPAAASSASARRPRARSSSTTTPTTRPRCRRRSRPPARSAPRRIVAVFQPHLFSRTRHQAREFGAALALADLVVVLDIYPGARARRRTSRASPGGSSPAAAADAAGGRPVAWLPGFDDAEAYLRAVLREGDVLLTLGAGDVDALGRRLLRAEPGPGQDSPVAPGRRSGPVGDSSGLDPAARRRGARTRLRAPRFRASPLRLLLLRSTVLGRARLRRLDVAARLLARRRPRRRGDRLDLQRGRRACAPRSTPPAAT